MRDYLKFYIPIAVLLVVGFAFASRYVNPAPPRHVRIASGAPQGAYAESARRYREIEERALAATAPAERAEIMRELDRVEAEVGKLQIPLGYGESHYNLRVHLQFIRRMLPSAQGTPQPGGGRATRLRSSDPKRCRSLAKHVTTAKTAAALSSRDRGAAGTVLSVGAIGIERGLLFLAPLAPWGEKSG